ncbi:cytochrome c oxidase subunit 4 [Marisediminicola sp. LYQ134]|uniref:cytochrome c oxidase subunit 4 n=1 Tax=unclassified Marisediminicola TaxID=2618316 RepID=UPI00398314CF
MVANIRIFWVLTVFFLLLGVVYSLWSYQDHLGSLSEVEREQPVEWVGTIGLFLGAILSALIAFYLSRTYKAQGGELPEDRLNANIDDGDAEQGFFSPWSWWPIVLAGGPALMFVGLAVGWWIAAIGFAITAIAIVGWTFEYYRGNFGR